MLWITALIHSLQRVGQLDIEICTVGWYLLAWKARVYLHCVRGMHRVYVLSFFFSSRRRHTRCSRDWSSDVCSSDLEVPFVFVPSYHSRRATAACLWPRSARALQYLRATRRRSRCKNPDRQRMELQDRKSVV